MQNTVTKTRAELLAETAGLVDFWADADILCNWDGHEEIDCPSCAMMRDAMRLVATRLFRESRAQATGLSEVFEVYSQEVT